MLAQRVETIKKTQLIESQRNQKRNKLNRGRERKGNDLKKIEEVRLKKMKKTQKRIRNKNKRKEINKNKTEKKR